MPGILAALCAVTMVPVAALTRFKLSLPVLIGLIGGGQAWLHWAFDAMSAEIPSAVSPALLSAHAGHTSGTLNHEALTMAAPVQGSAPGDSCSPHTPSPPWPPRCSLPTVSGPSRHWPTWLSPLFWAPNRPSSFRSGPRPVPRGRTLPPGTTRCGCLPGADLRRPHPPPKDSPFHNWQELPTAVRSASPDRPPACRS